MIAVWGLAYKPDTASTKNSPAVHLLQSLLSYRVRVYDPQATLGGVVGKNVVQTESALEACRGADVLVIMTPWREFAHLPVERVAERARKPVVIDCWRLLGDDIEDAVELVRLGTPLETHIAR